MSPRRERDDRVLSAVERGPHQLRHPRVDHDQPLRAIVRAGLARHHRKAERSGPVQPGGLAGRPDPLSDMEDARHDPTRARHQHAAGLDREAVRAPVRRNGRQERGELPGKAARVRNRHAERRDGEAAADVERVECRQPAAQERKQGQPPPDRVPPRTGGAQLRSDVEVKAAKPERPVRPAARIERGRHLVRGEPELRNGRAGRQASVRLGVNLGIEPKEHVHAESDVADSGASAGGHLPCRVYARGGRHPVVDRADGARQGGSLVRRLQRDPPERHAGSGGSGGRPQVRVGLADPLQRDVGVRDAGPRRERPLPARDDVRAKPQPREACHQGREVVCLQRVASLPGRREGRADGCRGRFHGRDVRDVSRRAVPSRDLPKGGREDPQPVASLAGRRRVHAVSPG